jgi:hypothetical protein
MKKIIAFFIFFWYCGHFAHSQDYIRYNKKVQHAEWCIVQGKYAKALRVYKRLYQRYAKTFVKDDLNAMTCALLLNKYEEAVYFDKRRIQKNTPLRESMAKELQKYYVSTPYQEAKKELDRLFQQGELIRKKDEVAEVYDSLRIAYQPIKMNLDDTSHKTMEMLKELWQIKTKTYNQFVTLLRIKGYTDDVMRVRQDYWTIFTFKIEKFDNDLLACIYDVPIDNEIQNLLYKEVQKGNLDLIHYFPLIYGKREPLKEGLFSNYTIFRVNQAMGAIVYYKNKLYFVQHPPKKRKELNKLRQQYGFKSMEEDYKKFIWMTHDKYFNFYSPFMYIVPRDDNFKNIIGYYYEPIPSKY